MFYLRILLIISMLNIAIQSFALPLVPNYAFHESFESETAITANSGKFTGTTIVPGFLGNAINIDNGDKLTFTKPNVFNAEEGTVMFWASPNYNLLDLFSHTYLSFLQAPIQATPNTIISSWEFAVSDGWWEPAGSPYFYFVYQPLHASLLGLRGPLLFEGNEWKFVTVTWKHPVGQLNQRELSIFVNGELQIRQTNYPETYPYDLPISLPVNDTFYVGTDRAGNRNVDARIDELTIYPFALTNSNIDNTYKDYLGTEWYNHRKLGWMQPEIAQIYNPPRNNKGQIVENRIMLDEAPFFVFDNTVDMVLDKLELANMNVYVPNVYHGAGSRIPSTVEKFQAGYGIHYQTTDKFTDLINKAHARGIEVHPWFTVALNQYKNGSDPHAAWALRDPNNLDRAVYNIHEPAFRKFIVDVMLDIVTRYDIDGVNLDYVRSGFICRTQFCQDDYRAKTSRDLISDIATVNYPPEFLKWQADAIEDIIRSFSEQARLIKPDLVISVDGHVPDEIKLGPTKTLAAYARNQIDWMQKGLIDVIYDMDYSKKLSTTYIEAARNMVAESFAITKLLGNYDRNIAKTVIPRDATTVADLVHYSQMKYPRTVALYIYSMFSDAQIAALTAGPFAEKSITNWVFDRPVITVEKPIENKTLQAGELNSYKATAYDARDGDLSNSIVWSAIATDSSERIIGSGAKMHAILNLTDDKIVVRVVNSLGKNEAVTININVIPKL